MQTERPIPKWFLNNAYFPSCNHLAKAVKRLVAKSQQTSRLLGDFLVVSVRRLVMAIGLLIGLAALEINVGPLLAIIGAAGFVIAFALQSSLGNFASGILVMVFKPFDIGDLVEIGGVLGKVQSRCFHSVPATRCTCV